jgi:DnaJ-class molecular chaperone
VDNHYATLNIAMDAPDTVVRAAWRALTAQYHPDRGGRGNARRMQQVNVAYQVLSDPQLRAEHDAALRGQRCRRAGDGRAGSVAVEVPAGSDAPEAIPATHHRAWVARFYAEHANPG